MLIKSQLISILYHRYGYVAYATAVIDDIKNIATATYYRKIVPHPETKVNSFSKIIAELLKNDPLYIVLSRKTAIFRGFFLFFDETAVFFDFCRVSLTAVFGVCGAEQFAIMPRTNEAFATAEQNTHRTRQAIQQAIYLCFFRLNWCTAQ